jgi:hypothetical protein
MFFNYGTSIHLKLQKLKHWKPLRRHLVLVLLGINVLGSHLTTILVLLDAYTCK